MRYAGRVPDGDLLKNTLNLVAAHLGIGNDVKGQSWISDIGDRMPEPAASPGYTPSQSTTIGWGPGAAFG